MSAVPQTLEEKRKAGLEYWADWVLKEYEKVGRRLGPDAVHDLRVALRRCQSMSDGIMELDPHPAWKDMKRACKRLLHGLGELRDVQVMTDWVIKLREPTDALADGLMEVLQKRESSGREAARKALKKFDRKEWKRWAKLLVPRAQRVPLGSPVFELLAVEAWNEAYSLHRRALDTRSRLAFHRLRIGLKRFRYTVENFLPHRHEEWGRELKELQDWLGSVHDLDVLWAAIVKLRARVGRDERKRWQKAIDHMRQQRVERYRQKMAGRKSLWWKWRASLPQGEALESAAMARFEVWDSFLDPDPAHAQRVSNLALQLYDGLTAEELAKTSSNGRMRFILQGAALMHDAGRSEGEKKHAEASYRLIRKLDPPPDWTAEEMQLVALTARYHQIDLPQPGDKGFRSLTTSKRKQVLFLSGILRLANALDMNHDGRVRQLKVRSEPEAVVILAEGYSEEEPLAVRLAATRHLLEVVCHRPVIIRPMPVRA